MTVPFFNLAAQTRALLPQLQAAAEQVLTDAHFIMGPNVKAFEQALAALTQTRHAVGVNSGSDALILTLRALGIRPGDEVITTPFTYIAPAEAIHQMGARVVFADVDEETFCLDPESVEKRINSRTRALLPVHLFGQAAPLGALLDLAAPRGIQVVEDCAQAIGATWNAQPVGGLSQAGCFSFYPTKNLGAHGDGGMVVTNDEALAGRLRMLRVHGMERRYYHDAHGYNSRLDEIQAALLRVKLPHLQDWNQRRVRIAARYTAGLDGLSLKLPATAPGNTHVYHVYAVLTEQRDALQQFLAERGIATLIYYPLPLHRQKVFADLGYHEGDFPVAESVAKRILPLPIYPELTGEQVDYVIGAIREFEGEDSKS
jgi:UDP-N-acetyl-3-dehydro-alpha-D-glucosamine 3-aminotranferase